MKRQYYIINEIFKYKEEGIRKEHYRVNALLKCHMAQCGECNEFYYIHNMIMIHLKVFKH